MNTSHKKAFSMITAVITIVIMATVTAMIMSVTGKTIKQTTQQYQKEQAMLLARSYTELAILYVLNYDRSALGNSCIETINATFGEIDNEYKIRLDIQYVANRELFPNECATNIASDWNISNPSGFDATISMIIDVYVSYKDFNDPSGRNITFHRRTLQKL